MGGGGSRCAAAGYHVARGAVGAMGPGGVEEPA